MDGGVFVEELTASIWLVPPGRGCCGRHFTAYERSVDQARAYHCHMARIVFIGAGSTVFARNLMGDILSFPELSESTIVLHDIDETRLRTSEIVGHKIIETLGVKATIEATTDRRAALAKADYVITMFQVGGYKPSTVIDFEIPKKFGLEQTIADTLGIGGIMRGLRTIPVMLDICKDMEELCPQAVLLNYVNPMSMLCWAVSRASSVKMIGLCHSVQHTAHQLATDLDIDPNQSGTDAQASTTWRSI